jgi:hypothetical protein
MTLEEILDAAKRLTPEERTRLASELVRDSAEPLHEVTELRGLGKEVWGNIDAQEYVDSERDSWDN